MTSKSRPLIIGGILLLLIGACSLLGGVALLFDVDNPNSDTTVSSALCLVFFGLPPSALGIAMIFLTRSRQERERRDYVENQILRAAVAHNYRLTAPEVAMMTELSLEEARKYLDDLARRGMVAVEVSTNGVLVYSFQDAKL